MKHSHSPAFLVTHSGGFHADELLSSVILTRLYPEAKLVRTRDEAMIVPGENRIIYDVGRDYNADTNIYDHHQKNVPLREDGNPFSSFGLIWKHFGRQYLSDLGVPEAFVDQIHASFDADFVLPIDLMDNGQLTTEQPELGALTLPALIESLKPVFDDPRENADDDAFADALPIVRAFVEARLTKKVAKKRAEAVVLDAISAAGQSAVLELPQGMPFRSAVEKAEADHLLFVVHPRDQDWILTGIRVRDDSFELRADLPQSWAGLTDEALEQACGVSGAKFCHNGRFIAVANSRDAILKMAEYAVAGVLTPA